MLLSIGRSSELAHGALRISLGDDCTEEQVDYIIKTVTEIVDYLRKFSPLWDDLINGRIESDL